jgi:hypothetical protein
MLKPRFVIPVIALGGLAIGSFMMIGGAVTRQLKHPIGSMPFLFFYDGI